MFSVLEDCHACRPGGNRQQAITSLGVSTFPLAGTLLVVALLVYRRLYPVLSGEIAGSPGFSHTFASGKIISASTISPTTASTTPRLVRTTTQQLSAIVCSFTIALSAVLVELILCEVLGRIDPTVRAAAFHIVVSLLLVLLILVIPFLEINAIITSAGWQYVRPAAHVDSRQKLLRVTWLVQLTSFAAWITLFWWSGVILLGQGFEGGQVSRTVKSIGEGSLDRIGVIGISIMSLLSGFASVSAPWQNLFSRSRPVSEAMVTGKAAGLDATRDMLMTKQARLQAIERKMSESSTETLFQKAVGSLRGNADHAERELLRLEISGLETMTRSLAAQHADLQHKLTQQQQARTVAGRLGIACAHGFSIFCLYRIVTTSLTFTQRCLASHHLTESSPVTSSDPVDHILALLARHYDPHLDQAAWARQISFLLSGIILFASFSSVMQTFRLVARFVPSLLNAIQTNLAMVVAQVCATYVISAAIMLRGMMPGNLVGEGLRSFGGSKDHLSWVGLWFEQWFLIGAFLTATGIWLGRKASFSNPIDWDDGFADRDADANDLESGKRS